MPKTLSIDGFGPLSVHRPATVADVGTLVKQQRAAKQGIYPVGGRTQLDFGLVPTKPGIALDMTALNKVIDYPARDMTITVEAGITLAELQAVLAKEGQWLPLDAPHPERSTLGGLVATNTSGPRRLGYGTLRDFVIGISFINDNGDEIKGGGRVVKNVAGYDLMKLHTGALGTLGVITQLTLKVRPKPEHADGLFVTCKPGQLNTLLNTIHAMSSRPVLSNLCSDRDEGMGVHIAFEEKKTTVQWQYEVAKKELREASFDDISDHFDPPLTCWGLCGGGLIPTVFIAKITMKPSQVAEYVTLQPEFNSIPDESWPWFEAETQNGIVWFYCQHPVELPKIGHPVIYRAPAAWKTPERVFGKPTPAFGLMRHIKRTLDPDDVFNPGRMFV
ncbi:FAD-binding oxidoreductase [soil metagenome]